MKNQHLKWVQNLVCPYSEGSLKWVEANQELWCKKSRLAYAVEDDMPVMLIDKARMLSEKELEMEFGHDREIKR